MLPSKYDTDDRLELVGNNNEDVLIKLLLTVTSKLETLNKLQVCS